MKQADILVSQMIATTQLMIAGKLNPRFASKAVNDFSKAADVAHKASIHTRYDKAVKRVAFYDQNVTDSNRVKVVDAESGKDIGEKNTLVIFTPKKTAFNRKKFGDVATA
jgi:hypothetical protein